MVLHGQSLRDRLGERPDARPRPAATAMLYLALAAGSLGVGLASSARTGWIVTITVSLVLAGFLQAGLSTVELARRRRVADSWLRTLRHCSPSSQYAWRAAELTSPRERRVCSRTLCRILAELGGRVLPGAVPVNRIELRPHARDIERLALRLADVGRPVSPAGMLLVNDLLTEPLSPLYGGAHADDLPRRVAAILAALEVD
jgi:Zn-dependent protease with chaperone function